jgi:hypothetical protein
MILAPVNLAKRGKTRALCRKVETTKKRGRRELGDDFYTIHSRQHGTCCSRTHWFVSVIMHGQIGRSKGALYLHRCQIKIIRQFFALTWWIYMCKSSWWIRFALWHVFKPSWDKRSTVATDATCDGRSWGWKKKCWDFGARMLYGCIKIINMFYCLWCYHATTFQVKQMLVVAGFHVALGHLRLFHFLQLQEDWYAWHVLRMWINNAHHLLPCPLKQVFFFFKKKKKPFPWEHQSNIAISSCFKLLYSARVKYMAELYSQIYL